jgi:malate dehydrogenase (oxaloacetate-decarboxylating)
MGISKLLMAHGVKTVIGTDLKESAKSMLAAAGGTAGSLDEVMNRSRIVVATTGVPGLIKPQMVRPGQVILALSNPNPEIAPEAALEAGAAFAADGKSVNNALGFPGIFRGALNVRASRIDNSMLIAAAESIAGCAEANEIVPSILHPEVHRQVTAAVELAAVNAGLARV